MDVTQARELYSAYYEGTIERVSATALDEAMKANQEIREDYEAFALVMDALPTLSEEAIMTPPDLHDKILAKLDHHDWEKKQSKRLVLFSNPKMAWFGAAAVALIAFAGFAIFQSGGTSSPAGTSYSPTQTVNVDFSADPESGTVHIKAPTTLGGSVTVKDADGKAQPEKFDLNKKALDLPLNNPNDAPVVIVVEPNVGVAHYLVQPGRVKNAQLTGEGTIIDCAKAVASTYGTPVEVKGDITKQAKWSFTAADKADTLVDALHRTNVNAVLPTSGILQVTAP